ncbi:MAG: hypothetical protein K8S56_03450 [Candidatus Cloacimonetes bacterium]|nr:hypothetical protein [Candidatus Cloacimonadota bacterium]
MKFIANSAFLLMAVFLSGWEHQGWMSYHQSDLNGNYGHFELHSGTDVSGNWSMENRFQLQYADRETTVPIMYQRSYGDNRLAFTRDFAKGFLTLYGRIEGSIDKESDTPMHLSAYPGVYYRDRSVGTGFYLDTHVIGMRLTSALDYKAYHYSWEESSDIMSGKGEDLTDSDLSGKLSLELRPDAMLNPLIKASFYHDLNNSDVCNYGEAGAGLAFRHCFTRNLHAKAELTASYVGYDPDTPGLILFDTRVNYKAGYSVALFTDYEFRGSIGESQSITQSVEVGIRRSLGMPKGNYSNRVEFSARINNDTILIFNLESYLHLGRILFSVGGKYWAVDYCDRVARAMSGIGFDFSRSLRLMLEFDTDIRDVAGETEIYNGFSTGIQFIY